MSQGYVIRNKKSGLFFVNSYKEWSEKGQVFKKDPRVAGKKKYWNHYQDLIDSGHDIEVLELSI